MEQKIKHLLKGKAGFLEYYRGMFNDEATFETWLHTIEHSNSPVLRFKPEDLAALQDLWQKAHLTWQPLSWYPYAVQWPTEVPIGTELPGFVEKLFYPMNAASLIPVLALQPEAGDIVLDACAAPGGKTLFIAELMQQQGSLLANDNSPSRRRRLQQALKDYRYDDFVDITHFKAEILFKQYDSHFDKILVDAPCSSEKHVYNSPIHLAKWSYARIKALKQRQIALLSGLFLALKPGGRIVYSTCATTREENEEIVATLLKKKGETIQLLPWTVETPGEAGLPMEDFNSEHVRRVWPTTNGLDPMFVAIFERLN